MGARGASRRKAASCFRWSASTGGLRTKLAEYYGGPGANDPVIIQMRKGGYAPDFEERDAPKRAPDPRRRLLLAAAVLAAVLAAASAVLIAARLGVAGRERGSSLVSVAVLPFAHHSASVDDDRLAARLTDGVTSALAATGAVSVVSHTSALQFSPPRGSLRRIAETLGAEVVMEATVLTEGDRVRVQARLVDGARDRKIWVEEFAGGAGDLDPLQRRIAIAVAAAANRPRRP